MAKKKIIYILIFILLFVLFLVLFKQLSKNNITNSNTDASRNKDSITQNDLVIADSNYMITESERQSQIVLCKKYHSKLESIKTLVIGSAPDLMNFILLNNLAIKGSIQILYNQIPKKGLNMDIWVGIPINRNIKVDPSKFEIIEIPSSKYFKVKSNYNWGESIEIWSKILEKLTSSEKQINFPIIEYPSDSRNAEMTTEISQMNLLIPFK